MLTGLWHGANFTFIMWGLIQGFFLIMNHIGSKPRKRLLKRLNISTDNLFLTFVDVLVTFIMVMFSWIFFRADSVGQAFSMLQHIMTPSLFQISILEIKKLSVGNDIIYVVFFSLLFLLTEWVQRDKPHPLEFTNSKIPLIIRWCLYYAVVILICWFQGNQQAFIYLQF
jgi:small-conductance mechanosensitive channel